MYSMYHILYLEQLVSLKKNILIIDNVPEFRAHMVKLFSSYYPGKLNIKVVKDGAEALQFVHCIKFDCIIADLNGQILNGELLIEAISKSQLNKSCPVVVISSSTVEELIKNIPYLIVLPRVFNKRDFIDIFTNQLKLGSNQNRISSLVLNAFISEMSNFITTNVESDISYSPAILKTSYDHIQNDCCLKAEVHIKNTINTYVIGIDKKFARIIKKSLLVKKVRESDIALTLLSYARDLMLKKNNFTDVRFKNIRFFCDDQAKRCLREATGVIVNTRFKSGNINIIAVSGTMPNPDTNSTLSHENSCSTESIKYIA